MQRGLTGRYEVTTVGGEPVRAFLPRPLPPEPPLQLNGSSPALQEQALLALGRLDALSTLLPDTHLFLYSYVRKEAVLSSQIDGSKARPRLRVLPVPGGPAGGDGATVSSAPMKSERSMLDFHGGLSRAVTT